MAKVTTPFDFANSPSTMVLPALRTVAYQGKPLLTWDEESKNVEIVASDLNSREVTQIKAVLNHFNVPMSHIVEIDGQYVEVTAFRPLAGSKFELGEPASNGEATAEATAEATPKRKPGRPRKATE